MTSKSIHYQSTTPRVKVHSGRVDIISVTKVVPGQTLIDLYYYPVLDNLDSYRDSNTLVH